MYEELDPVI